MSDPSGPEFEKYRARVRRFGVADPAGRVGDFEELAGREVRFFALRQAGGWILKAAATPTGLVESGLQPADDWRGYLSGFVDARAAARGLAWLETDETPREGVYAITPITALDPAARPEGRTLDPAHWALVTAPSLGRDAQGTITFDAWFLRAGSAPPERWTVTVPAIAPAAIALTSAAELAPPSDPNARARSLLANGSLEDRRWAVRQLSRTGGPAAAADLSAVLATGPAELHGDVVFALVYLGDEAAIPALGRALKDDPSVDVRRACAESLGKFLTADAIAALAAAAGDEPDDDVRLHVVHALGAQGAAARRILVKIGKAERNPAIRTLARSYADRLR